ncbi:hypothetical protein IMX26_13315 [Clostridium sp. 'deep sea']|uniref:Athe_2463 domain-containing protein n=1 Tax=Clostridium sp. 'deep sea' TaxID=2779445 RepID=UPI001896692D|nr:hypothetical protein [Clostridium sp. 'deep sea']QOR34460.1 hypothetical protein IMX26_13315 [Clostridium sp. 'deep sea']
MRKKITVLLVLVLLINALTPRVVIGASNNPNVYQGISAQISYSSIQEELPIGISQYNAKNMPINTELWQDKHLVVYGDYSTVNYGSANVKYYHEDDPNNLESYYFRDSEGKKCEYRYLGYTREGNKFPNPKFPADYRTDIPPEDITWYSYPWRLGKHYMREISYTNKEVIAYKSNSNKAIEYINNSLDWYINRAIDGRNNQKLKSNEIMGLEKFYFFNVDSPPSALHPGRGRMINHSYSRNKDYYWTFSIPAVKGKNQTPIEARCTILNKNELVYDTGEQKKIAKVEVIGLLKDEEFYDNVSYGMYSGKEVDAYERSVNYCREDIKEWNITLNTPGGQALKAIKKSNNGINGVKNVFYVELSRDLVDSGTVEFHASLFIDYKTKEKSNTATAMDNADITAKASLFSYFEITNIIEKQGYSASALNYQDASVGDIAKYEWTIVNMTTLEQHSFNYPIAITSNVEKEIFNFTNPYIQANEADCSFEVTQTVSNDKGMSNSYKQTINFTRSLEPPAIVVPDCSIPKKAIDMVAFKPSDNTDLSEAMSKSVTVDGREVDYNRFFSGNYTFCETIGLLGANDKLVKVSVNYQSIDNQESHFTTWVYVYTSKPRLDYSISGTTKVNRKIELTNVSESCNDDYVLNKYPISYSWQIEALEGDMADLKMRAGYTNNVNKKVFLTKKEGLYRFTLKGNNGLRDGDPYSIDIPIYKDYNPAVIFNVWNNVLARNEQLHITVEAVSLDDDIITTQSLKILYDKDEDGEFETELKSYDNAKNYDGYIPTELGSYQMVYEVHEDFGQDTLLEFIKPEDERFTIEKREFHVENLSPMTKMYVDIPLEFPEADIYILTDPNLNLNKIGEVKGKRIDIVNNLRQSSIVPEVNIWDLHTYVYSQEVTRTRNTGGSYPSSSISYSNNGYSGTLHKYRTVNDDYKVDRGKYVTKTDSKTATGSISSTAWSEYDADGNLVDSYSPGTYSISYNSGGYSGTLYKTSVKKLGSKTVKHSDGSKTQYQYYRGYYSGTVTKTYEVWVAKWVSYDDYTGYYRGTVYKHVKQPFNDIFRDTSEKYIIYIADGSITGNSDLSMLKNRSDSKIIYSSSVANKNNVQHDFFIEYTGNVDSILAEALEIIKNENPYELQYTLLLNNSLNIKFADIDAENDPLDKLTYQVVHDPNVFDNNTGIASFANSSYSDGNYQEISKSNLDLNFTKKGKYLVYRKITDKPIDHENKGLHSNEPKLEVLVHEKPIADFDLQWLYNYNTQVYDTTWLDKSYDPDFQFSRADKGIIDRKIRFRKVGKPWSYKIPETLDVGSYQLEYRVKDVFAVWSDVKSFNFSLQANPPVEVEYTINYVCNNEVFYSETITEIMQGIPSKTKTFYARDFNPLYKLADAHSKIARVSYQRPKTTIEFNYNFVATTEAKINITLSGKRLRPGNIIASGYGININALANITVGYNKNLLSGTPQMQVIWLENKPYEWTYNNIYQVANNYSMEWISGPIDSCEFTLEPNNDSNIKARKIYSPVELTDGEYDCIVKFYGVKYPTWYINSKGNVIRGEDLELTYQETFIITIDGSMYDDINVIS